MMEAVVTEKNGKIYLEGMLNEHCDFNKIFSGKQSPIVIDMKGVHGINSVGIRDWAKALREATEVKVILEHCPKEVIDQCNLLPEFMGEDQVRISSFYVYYYSEEEDEEQMVLLEENEHFVWGEGLIKEPEVDEGMELDENPDKYFAFLTR